MSPAHIERRTKKRASFEEKLRRLEKDVTALNQVTDLVGVRIIFYSPKDIDTAALLLAADFKVIEDELHGMADLGVATFGYSSRHLIVELGDHRCALAEWQKFAGLYAEIQLTSVLQHAWASRSHKFDYKAAQIAPEPIRRKLFRLAALLEIADDQFDELEHEAEKTREAYIAQIKKGQAEAEELELTGASLDAYLVEYPVLDSIVSLATNAGFDASALDGKRGSIEDFIDYARASGFTTLGEVRHYAEAVANRESDLRAIVSESQALEFTPAALPFDVLVFLLSLDQRAAFEKLRTSSYDDAIKVAVETLRSKSPPVDD